MERKVDVDCDTRINSAAGSQGVMSDDPNRPVQAWQFVDGFQRLLGDDAEPDPLFFVESWTLGMPVAVERFMQRRKEQPEPRYPDEAARGIENRGTVSVIPEYGIRAGLGSPELSATAGDWEAAHTQQYSESNVARTYESYPEDSAMGSEGFPGGLTTEPITELDACQILGVTAKSSRRQIRAAYHRKVSQWHPDRLEQGSEEMRLFATEQMAAINHAYHLLTSD
jgi:hypothetical protein